MAPGRSARAPPALHSARIIWPATALGGHPVDVLRRILDVAGVAGGAVRRVDLEAGRALHGIDDLVNARWAIARFRAAKALPVERDCKIGIGQPKMWRLILLVIGVADKYR